MRTDYKRDKAKTEYKRQTKSDRTMKRESCLCCGQRGSMMADIKVQRMDRDERKGLEAI